MVNLAEKHEEDSSAQLADGEISRILTALQKAEFKRSESGNARPDQTFKPRSLMEIAETALKQDEVARADQKATGMATTGTAPEDTKKQPDQINSDDGRQGPNSATATDTADPAMQLAAMPTGVASGDIIGDADQVGTGASDASPLGAPQLHQEALAGGGELPATDMGVGADAGHESGAGHAAPTSPFETAKAAYDRGYGDGIAAGREAAEAELRKTIEAEFEAKLTNKIKAFETALIGLAKPQAVDTGALSRSLQTAVIRLAAARTGAAIDEMPELMVARIDSLADAAGKHVEAGHVFMHPDDCEVIAPIMETRQDQFTIKSDPNLDRGDICIRFDGIEISDVADLRADWQISQSMQRENSVEVETAQTEISDVELETPTVNNLNLDAQEVLAQSSINSPLLQEGENGEPMLDENEDNEDASTSEAIGLMPLTTTGGDDTASDGGTGDNEDASPSEAIGLMPLTTTGRDDSASDGVTEDNEDASLSERIGLTPLTSKNFDE